MHLSFATSCLSHLSLLGACQELAAVGRAAVGEGVIASWGLQLCPGHHGLDLGMAARTWERVQALALGGRLRLHDGFSFHAPSQRVWSSQGRLVDSPPLVVPRSVHPPKAPTSNAWVAAAAAAIGRGELAGIEVMYGDYAVRDPASLPPLPLVVDVSHLHLWADSRGSFAHLDRRPIAEVHVSDNDGSGDQHRPIHPGSFGLHWARERARDGVPVVIEARMRYLSFAARLEQVRHFTGANE